MVQPARLLLAALLVTACKSTPEAPSVYLPAPPGAICTLEARPAITAEPVDARTGGKVSGNVLMIVRDGIYADTARSDGPPNSNALSAAYERAGTYSVVIHHPEYREWTREGIVVLRDECHVLPARLRAELTPRVP